jgi:hypothetical protein
MYDIISVINKSHKYVKSRKKHERMSFTFHYHLGVRTTKRCKRKRRYVRGGPEINKKASFDLLQSGNTACSGQTTSFANMEGTYRKEHR